LIAAYADVEAAILQQAVEGVVAMEPEAEEEAEMEEMERYHWTIEERRLILEERRLEGQRLQREQEERRWHKEYELREREREISSKSLS